MTLDDGSQAFVPLGQWGISRTEDETRFTEYNEFLDYTITYSFDEATGTLVVNDTLTIENFTNGDDQVYGGEGMDTLYECCVAYGNDKLFASIEVLALHS